MSDKTAPQPEHYWRERIASAIGARWAAVCNEDHDPQNCDVCRHYADAVAFNDGLRRAILIVSEHLTLTAGSGPSIIGPSADT